MRIRENSDEKPDVVLEIRKSPPKSKDTTCKLTVRQKPFDFV